MNIRDLLSPSEVLPDLRVADKRRLLQTLAAHAAEALELEAQQVLDALLAREELGSTGMGEGTAMPHARLADVKKPFVTFARLRSPIEFDSIDGRPVDLVCLLLLPTTPQGEQLSSLACVARRFRDQDLLARLRTASSGADLYDALTASPAPV